MKAARSNTPVPYDLVRHKWLVIVVLTLLAFLLRVYRLDYVPLRGDESFTVIFLSDPLPVIWEGIRFVEPNPPLFYMLLYAFMALVGTADFATRYFSVVFGVLAVPLIYVLGRRLTRCGQGRPNSLRVANSVGAAETEFAAGNEFGGSSGEFSSAPLPPRTLAQGVATVAALAMAVNPYQIWHSQDLRNYTLWPALSMASLYLLLRTLDETVDPRPQERTGHLRWWAGYIAITLLSLYTHYFDVFLVVFQNIYVFALYWRRWPLLRRWIIAQAVLVAAYAPWPLLLSSRPFTYVDLTDVPSLPALVRRTFGHFMLGETMSQPQMRVALPVMALLVLLGLAAAFRLRRRAFFFLTLYPGVPLLCTVAFLQFQPIFRVRYLNATAPGYYLALAFVVAGLTQLPVGRRLGLTLALGAVLLASGVSLGQYYFDPDYAKSPDWRALARYLEARAGPQDVIVQTYPDPGLVHYYHGPAQHLVLPDRPAVDQIGDLPVDRVTTAQTLQELLAPGGRLWLVPIRSNWDPQAFVEGWLERRAEKVGEEQVAGFRVVSYQRADRPPPSFQYPIDARFGDGIRLLGYDLAAEGRVMRPGAALELTLYWEALAPGDAVYTVFTHLVDADGGLHTQHDAQPQAGAFPTSDWLPGDVIPDPHPMTLPVDAAPGTYHLLVGLYRLESGERLPALDPSGKRWPHDAVELQPPLEIVEP